MHDTSISIPASDVTLQGTFAAAGVAPAAAALLISGSGPIDRDSNSKRMPIDVMRQVAEHLSGSGIASLRYDKRGVGESGGDYLSTGFHDNVDDASAALAALRARPEVDADRVVVIGHSEGALIADVLAADPQLAGVVLLAGSAVDGKQLLRWQAEQLAPTLPKPAQWLMKLLRSDLVATQTKRLGRLETSTDDVIRIQLVKLNARWFREFMAFEPTQALRRAVVPVLAITGSKDVQVDPADIERMRQVVPTSFEGHVVDDVTHLLRSEPGVATVRTYKQQARRPIDQRVTRLLTDWVSAQTAENGEQR